MQFDASLEKIVDSSLGGSVLSARQKNSQLIAEKHREEINRVFLEKSQPAVSDGSPRILLKDALALTNATVLGRELGCDKRTAKKLIKRMSQSDFASWVTADLKSNLVEIKRRGDVKFVAEIEAQLIIAFNRHAPIVNANFNQLNVTKSGEEEKSVTQVDLMRYQQLITPVVEVVENVESNPVSPESTC